MELITHKITKDEFDELLRTSEYGSKYLSVIKMGDKRIKPTNMRGRSIKGYERHHIIPRAFGGEDKDNIVLLTVYEHILVHYYLVLMTKNVHMFHAFNWMMGKQYTKLTDLEKIQLSELKHWAEIREQARKRMFSIEGRQTISLKAKERWDDWKKTGKIDKIKKNIARTTKEGMANSIKSQIRTRANLGCKKYWNPETGECRNWYPGMPEFTEPWIRGRKPMSKEAKEKLSITIKKDPHKWYHNDELKLNRTFKQSEIVPDGWIHGIKKEYEGNYAKIKRQLKEDKLQELQSTHQ